MYKPTIWQDHVEGVQEGTDMNAANFNNIEVGTMEANALAAMNSAHQRYATDKAKDTEVIVVESFISFDYDIGAMPDVFVAIPNNATRNNTNYTVVPVITSNLAGDVSVVAVFDKQVNGFKVRTSAEDGQVDFYLLISGGMI